MAVVKLNIFLENLGMLLGPDREEHGTIGQVLRQAELLAISWLYQGCGVMRSYGPAASPGSTTGQAEGHRESCVTYCVIIHNHFQVSSLAYMNGSLQVSG